MELIRRRRVGAGMVLELVRGSETLGSVRVLFNLTNNEEALPMRLDDSFVWTSESERYDGMRRRETSRTQLLPYECIVLDNGLTHAR